ncbi:MAG: hypothetical protein HQK99_07985 [Nitrospirae bacterium]|nr:hypothetical protein [Nitrospirota bacterium]
MKKILVLSIVAVVMLSGLCYGMEELSFSPKGSPVLAAGDGHILTSYRTELSFSPSKH